MTEAGTPDTTPAAPTGNPLLPIIDRLDAAFDDLAGPTMNIIKLAGDNGAVGLAVRPLAKSLGEATKAINEVLLALHDLSKAQAVQPAAADAEQFRSPQEIPALDVWAGERWERETAHFVNALGLLVHVMEADAEVPGGYLRPITNALGETQDYLYETRDRVNRRLAYLEGEVKRLTTEARS